MIEYKVEVYPDGTKSWYLNGQRHRDDGPAIECANGGKSWYLNGQRHREDGPAIECADGNKIWFVNDQRHREDGPAVECADGTKSWYLNGVLMTKEEHKAAMNSVVEEMTMEEICAALGKTVKVIK